MKYHNSSPVASNQFFSTALLLLIVLLTSTNMPASPIDDAAKQIGRGVNLGNALEAPREGQWGWKIQNSDLDAIKSAGFTNVRVPISWAYYVDAKPPYTVDSKFFARIDEVIDYAVSKGLIVILNDHHENELYKDP
ncbi:MAG: cellulase family glycosylhydrolase, partial [Candidatus Sumerlaeota bacterium]